MKHIVIAVVSFSLGLITVLAVQHRLTPPTVLAQFSGGPPPFIPPLSAAVPKIQPPNVFVDHNTVISDSPPQYYLDGMILKNSVIASPRGVIITYGGGAYHLENVAISGAIGLELTGAAANTARLLESLGLMRVPNAPSPESKTKLPVTVPPINLEEPPNNQPIIKKLRLANPLKGDISSQYDGTKQ
jgi:hypothetical protein